MKTSQNTRPRARVHITEDGLLHTSPSIPWWVRAGANVLATLLALSFLSSGLAISDALAKDPTSVPEALWVGVPAIPVALLFAGIVLGARLRAYLRGER